MEPNDRLIEAATDGNLERIEEALADGADIDYTRPDGFPALHYAMRMYPHNPKKPVLELVEFLIKKGADPNAAYSEGETPFMTACLEGHTKVVELLYDAKKTNVNVHFNNGNSLLDDLVLKMKNRPMNFKVTKTIDGKKVTLTDPDEIRAAVGSHPDDEFYSYLKIAEFLLDRGIEVNSKNKNEQSALYLAASEGVIEMAALLISKGAEVNMKDKWETSPLHFAARNGFDAIIEMFIKAGANVNAGDGWGFTPLHEAVMSNKESTVALLMKNGADPKQGLTKEYDAKTPKGTSALDMAEAKKLTNLIVHMKANPTPKYEPPRPKKDGERVGTTGDEWKWNIEKNTHDGVTFMNDKIFWYTHDESRQGGGGSSQEYEDFLLKGSNSIIPPQNVEDALRIAVKKRLAEREG